MYMSTTWVYLYICELVLGLPFPSNVMQAFMELVLLAAFASDKLTRVSLHVAENGIHANPTYYGPALKEPSHQTTKLLQRVLCIMEAKPIIRSTTNFRFV